jgi:hypothetical protein
MRAFASAMSRIRNLIPPYRSRKLKNGRYVKSGVRTGAATPLSFQTGSVTRYKEGSPAR